MDRLRQQPLLLSFLFCAWLFVILCNIFIPCWASNDDVGMSMIAHGYGNVAKGVPTLLFSNVLWGYVVRAIPNIAGIFGYSIATMLSMFIAGTVIGWGMLRLGVSHVVAALTLALILVTPLTFPQFTVVSALYAIAAFITLSVYDRVPKRGILLAACLLAFASYLIRDQKFLLIVAVSLPFLPWRLLRSREVQVALLLFIAAIAGAWWFNWQAYQGSEWNDYHLFNAVRLPFTDFSAAKYSVHYPDILMKNGFSVNDMRLFSNWFFIDPQLMDVTRLNGVLKDLGPLAMQKGSAALSAEGLGLLFGIMLLPQWVPAAILYYKTHDRRVVLSFALVLAAVFTFSLLGRPGVIHVYQGLVYFMLVAATLKSAAVGYPRWLPLIMVFALVAMLGELTASQRVAYAHTEALKKEVTQLPREPIVTWGAIFPHEYMYPVLAGDSPARELKLYALGVTTMAPFSRAHQLEEGGFHALERLRGPEGLLVSTNQIQMSLLVPYCAEHFGRSFNANPVFESPAISVYRLRCVE